MKKLTSAFIINGLVAFVFILATLQKFPGLSTSVDDHIGGLIIGVISAFTGSGVLNSISIVAK